MERLVDTGEVFCRPYEYFKTIEPVDFRHDPNEGAGFIEQVRNLELMDPATKAVFGKADAVQLYFHHRSNQGNIYCVFGIETETLDLASSDIKPLNLDVSGLDFGETAVVIFNPGVFIERFESAVKSSGLEVECGPVIYYDHTLHKGPLTPFHKSNKFSPQREIRFWIPNQQNKDMVFHLGDLSDIAQTVPKADLARLSYGPA